MRPEQVSTPKSGGRFKNLEQPQIEKPTAVLEELLGLLEDYGPTWYTKAHHDRALAALVGRGH